MVECLGMVVGSKARERGWRSWARVGVPIFLACRRDSPETQKPVRVPSKSAPGPHLGLPRSPAPFTGRLGSLGVAQSPETVLGSGCGHLGCLQQVQRDCQLALLVLLVPSPAAPLCAAPPDARSRSSPSSRPLFYLFERLDTASRAARENTESNCSSSK